MEPTKEGVCGGSATAFEKSLFPSSRQAPHVASEPALKEEKVLAWRNEGQGAGQPAPHLLLALLQGGQAQTALSVLPFYRQEE